jgi:16S rRNA (guanine1516-N2)-methyltransferase
MQKRADIAVCALHPTLGQKAEELAAALHLPLAEPGGSHRLLLRYTLAGLDLVRQHDPHLTGSVRADFTDSRSLHRLLMPGKELLVRAVAGKKNRISTVLDGTGGLGRDGFLLARAGYRVTMYEKNPVIAALLADGLSRAREHVKTAETAARIQLVCRDVLPKLRENARNNIRTEVIYLDPMFPPRRKSAKVKKELQLLQLLAHGEDCGLLEAALAAARKVVVKRPVKAAPLSALAPDYSLAGKTVRFDVYLPVPGG